MFDDIMSNMDKELAQQKAKVMSFTNLNLLKFIFKLINLKFKNKSQG